MKKFFKIPKNSTVSWLCALAIAFSYKMKNSHCSREVSNSAANTILTHSALSNAQECHAQLCTCWLTAAAQVPTYVRIFCSFWWLTDQVRTLLFLRECLQFVSLSASSLIEFVLCSFCRQPGCLQFGRLLEFFFHFWTITDRLYCTIDI